MNAYESHWCIQDDCLECLNTYDSGVTLTETTDSTGGFTKGVVGILQHILKLDYGSSLYTPIAFFIYKWQNHQDTHGNDTYVRDVDVFLMVNFKPKAPKSVDPFAF